MMHRTRVREVRGNKVLADGVWLTCIGNRTVREGEWVWTDGRCVYGHESDGGGSYTPTNVLSGIPLLEVVWKDHKNQMRHSYYAKGKIHPLGFSKEEVRMVNNGSRFALLPSRGILDAEMDENGNVYTLESAHIIVHPILGYEEYYGVGHVKRNGEIVATYDLERAFGSPAISDPGDSYTCQVEAGRVDDQGRFKLLVLHSVSSWQQGTNVSQYVFFDGTNQEPWKKKSKTRTVWHAPDYSIRFPLYDGMYMRFDSELELTKIYNEQNEFLLETKVDSYLQISLCPLGNGKYLVQLMGRVYLWEDGQLTELMRGCYNFRLRRMSNLNKWKKAGGV